MNTTQNIRMKSAKSVIKGFTMLETLLVLMVTTFLIIMFSTVLGSTIHTVRGELFIAKFENSYKHTQFQAAATNQPLTFSSSGSTLTAGNQQIEIPEEVKISSFSIKFDRHGNNSSLKKIELNMPYERKNIIYQLEMGSGKYKKTIQ